MDRNEFDKWPQSPERIPQLSEKCDANGFKKNEKKNAVIMMRVIVLGEEKDANTCLCI